MGEAKLNVELEGRLFDFKGDEGGLHILVGSNEVFHFHLKYIDLMSEVGFSLAYERIKPSEENYVNPFMLTQGINPYDSNLPEHRISILKDIREILLTVI